MKGPTARLAGVLLLSAVALTACAAGVHVAEAGPGVAGFWLGLWHGLIIPITFLVSLFPTGVGIYEVHNDGVWYDLGFMVGISAVFSGPASVRRGRRRASSPRPA